MNRRLKKSTSRLGRKQALYNSTALGSNLSSAMMISAWATVKNLQYGAGTIREGNGHYIAFATRFYPDAPHCRTTRQKGHANHRSVLNRFCRRRTVQKTCS